MAGMRDRGEAEGQPAEAGRLLEALTAILGPRGVLSDPQEIAVWLSDWRGLYHGRALAVLRPASTAEVAAVLRLAAAEGLAIVPQGGRTSMAAGSTPDAGAGNLLMRFDRMARIVDIDRTGMTVTVEAGAVVDTVRAALREVGRDLPIAFGASGSATIGGVIATNAGGANVLRYGMTERAVLSVEAVLADGTVIGGVSRLHKDNSGLNWRALFLGSEGALGVVTRAVLRIQPATPFVGTAFLAVPDPAAALKLYERAQDMLGERLSAVELMSEACVARAEAVMDLHPPIARAPWMLLVEAASVSPSVEADFTAFVEAAWEEGLASDGALASSAAQRGAFWALRDGLNEAEARSGRAAKHDISVPVRDIPAFVETAGAALAALDPGLSLNVFGHVGDGNLHFNVLGATDQTMPTINRTVHDIVMRFGGSISAEHGIGQYRLDEAYRLLPPAQLALQEKLKALFDPEGRMNPGKLVRLPPG